MQEILLGSRKHKGYVALVDDEDYERVSQYKWSVDMAGQLVYAQRHPTDENPYRSLHRFVLGISDPTIFIDHEDHNGLNCQRYNLRVASGKQNSRNARKTVRPTSSRYKGVCWDKTEKNWYAYINIAKKHKYLGSFHSEEDAGRAYDTAARLHFGEFALTNF